MTRPFSAWRGSVQPFMLLRTSRTMGDLVLFIRPLLTKCPTCGLIVPGTEISLPQTSIDRGFLQYALPACWHKEDVHFSCQLRLPSVQGVVDD